MHHIHYSCSMCQCEVSKSNSLQFETYEKVNVSYQIHLWHAHAGLWWVQIIGQRQVIWNYKAEARAFFAMSFTLGWRQKSELWTWATRINAWHWKGLDLQDCSTTCQLSVNKTRKHRVCDVLLQEDKTALGWELEYSSHEFIPCPPVSPFRGHLLFACNSNMVDHSKQCSWHDGHFIP